MKAKQISQFIFRRVVIVALLLIAQVATMVVFQVHFSSYSSWFYMASVFASLMAVFAILTSRSNPAYKIAWIVLIMAFPIFGGPFYLLFGTSRLSRHTKKKMSIIMQKMLYYDAPHEHLQKLLYAENPTAALQSGYIERGAHCPVYSHTMCEYHEIGEKSWKRMLEELEKAEHYIFLEYFIIEEGEMWNSILEILRRKAAQGVDVRVLYDDLGCIFKLPDGYDKLLESYGIRACVFNPFIPVLNLRMNNRDHRKLCVIDGHTGFTGGINLADEYINVHEIHGHWKDTAIMLKGDAVWSLTVMFLTMWDFVKGDKTDFELYRPQIHQNTQYLSDGLVQPFTDNPLDNEPVGENVYLNMINRAQRYVYITTPYLIISNEMMTALTNAAKSGVDVRIITPHVPDKWYVHMVSQAHYPRLVEAGVRIFEYTPGFIHAKTFVSDDLYAVVGTINLDYRSLYLHFECATWLYRNSSIRAIYHDFEHTQEVSQEITLADCRAVPFRKRLLRNILKVFAPLM